MAEKKEVSADKLKVLNAVLDKIEKDFGKGAVMRMSSDKVEEVAVIPSGSITLDMALGVGGYPKGRGVEIFGPESSGKTTLALHAIAEAQKAGGLAAFIDAEHAFDRSYAQALGVDVDNLLISQPDNGEQALEIADSLIRSSAIDIIVIDSVAALTPKAEIEGDMGESKMGLQARLMSQALRKLTASISKTKTVCIFNYHCVAVGYIHTCFNYSCRHQHIYLTINEITHYLLKLPFSHLTVGICHICIRNKLLNVCSRLINASYTVVYIVYLTVSGKLSCDCLSYHLVIMLCNESLYRNTVNRRLLKYTHIPDSRKAHVKRSWHRSRTERKYINIVL